MAGVTVFQDHHVIERQAADKSALLQNLAKQRLFNLDDPANRLNLPADPDMAAKIGIYPHSGGPLAEYSRGLGRHLLDLENSLDGQLALQGDKAAAVRIAEQVNTLRNTMRAGLVNDDLLTNKPIDMTVVEARAKINSFFRDLESYTKNHAAQIDRFARGQVNVWEAVTVSETKVQSALDAIELSGKKAAKGPAEAAKFGLGLAVAEARQTGRLVVSPAFAQKLDTIWDTKLLDDILNGKTVVSSTNMATLFKGLKVVGVAGLIYDIGTSTAEAANASNKGDRAGAANIMARLAGRLYLGMEGAALGAAIGGAVGAPGGPVALASSVVGALVGGIGGAFIGDAAVEALWKAADDVISLLQAGTPEAGVDTPLLQPSGKYYRGLIASGMTKEVADKLVRQMNAEYKERRLQQPNASVESLIESVIKDVRANQAIEPEDEAGANVTVIRGAEYFTTIINSDSGKIETINDIKSGKLVSSKLFDSQGRKAGDIWFNSDGSSLENSYDPLTGRVATATKLNVDNSRSKQIFNSRGDVAREQRFGPSGNLTFDTEIETQKQVALSQETTRRNAADAKPNISPVANVTSQIDAHRKIIAEAEVRANTIIDQQRQADASKTIANMQADFKAAAKAIATAQINFDATAKLIAEAEARRKDVFEAIAKGEAQRRASAKAAAERQAAAKAEAERQAAARAEAERQAAAKAEAERQAAARAEAERQAAAKAEAERQAAARAEAERQAAAEKAERDRIASEEARKAQELQLQRYNERLKQEEQSRRERDERQRQWELQQQREADQRRQQAADQARRDAERERLRLESENAAFENMRRQNTFSNLPPSSTIFKQPVNLIYVTIGGKGYQSGRRIWPVALDLNGDVELDIRPLSMTKSELPKVDNIDELPHFDANGDGIRDQVAWIGPNDGMLVIDLGSNEATGPDGQIKQPGEVAFSLWKPEEQRVAELKEKGIDDTGRPVTDLEGLRFAFDTNQDNILDNRDARWSEFRIWQDFNQNGATDDGELSRLEAEGITFIDLLPLEQGVKSFPDGSMITGTSSAKRIDGTSILVGDVALAYRPSQAGL